MGSKSAIGIGNGICFKQVRDKGGGSYIDPLVRDSLVGVWIADQNTNESPTRNIIKNTIKNKGGDLELLNFGYKLNSGYNGYLEDFTSWKNSTNLRVEYSNDGSKCKITSENIKDWWQIAPKSGISNSFKVKITNCHFPIVWRYTDDGNTYKDINIIEDGIYNLPQSIINNEGVVNKCYFECDSRRDDYTGLTIEQLPLYEGALVTDGKDDMIVSQKTVQEMGITDEITVVSMIHQIGGYNSGTSYTNYIRYLNKGYIRNNVLLNGVGKTGIYGYTWNGSVQALINNILGDKSDYSCQNNLVNLQSKFSVEGYINNGSSTECSEVAVYWTFIANKVLTTDEINQIIAYFKLDKYVTPQVIYDVKRQGLTNDTPEADWYLKDFSGNGYDMQLYNFAKKLSSGIGKYEVDFNTWIPQSYVADSTYTSNKLHVTNIKGGNAILYTRKETNAMKVKITGIQSFNLVYRYIVENDVWGAFKVDRDGIYELPASTTTTKTYYTGFTVLYYTGDCDITIEQIPDYEGALVSDGIDDYGKVENLPIYKDYTVVADREIVDGLIDNADGGVAIRSYNYAKGAFGFDWKNQAFSFGGNTDRIIDVQRFISYQSKYINNGIQLITGNVVDNNPLYMARLGEDNRYSKLALWSFLLFPYTLSEFLLERQLKRYKLGTLYPGMIEWRPKVNINVPVVTPPTFSMNNGSDIITNGQYIPEGTEITIRIFTTTDSSVGGLNEATAKINGVDIELSPSGNKTYYGGKFIVSSKQKIDITIDEYIRYEDIVQPYPAIINLKQDGKTITWGDKLKVGSDIVFVGNANLLPELYTVSETRYNGVTLYLNTIIKVEKSMVFDNARIYLKANEPSCILSPNRLRIPNSSYKILGYIPDLTGKGNHGRLNNFAYAGMSGANGYVEDFTKWRISKSNIFSTISDSSIHFTHIGVNYEQTIAIFETKATSNKKYNIKVRISGLTSNMRCFFNNTNEHSLQELVNGVNEISVDLIVGWYGFNINTLDGSVIGDCDITIQQIGEHEDSICFDGTDDHITIPTLAHGGKCVMMKVNWSNGGTLYDQRLNNSIYTFSILSGEASLAYNARNNGSTYIDGILNANIISSDLVGITHNITVVNDAAIDNNTTSPRLGVSVTNTTFSNMSLYEFMLFPEIPSEDEIKKLNDVMGIEGGYVESPNYYWDAYGKTNSDADRATIIDQVSKDPVNALTANNFAFNEESGYVDNRLVSDGIEDNLKNTNMPVLTDYTWIIKRQFPDISKMQTFVHKGNGSNNSAFLFEFNENGQKTRSFGHDTTVVFPDLISYQTKNSYNGEAIAADNTVDGNQLRVFMGSDQYPRYAKAVFYKAMLYSKTIDTLSINMLKNLFERDELIDVNNPIFKKKEL